MSFITSYKIKHMMYDYGYGSDFGMFHLLWLVFWIAVIFFAVRYFRRAHAHGGKWHMPWPDKGLDMLKERFAKGEITKEEYEEKKKVLMS